MTLGLVWAGEVCAASLPQQTATYMADAVLNQGADSIELRIYHKRGRERLEMDLDGRTQVTILRPDLGLAYLVVPNRDLYYEILLEDVGPMALPQGSGRYQIEAGGTEIIEGETTTKFLVTGSVPVGGSADLAVWSTADGIYMRVEGTYSIGGEVLDFSIYKTAVVRRDLADSLFDLPPGAENNDKGPAFVDDGELLSGTE